MASSKNTILIRYADVLLWKAEALIELGQPDGARTIVNQIRTRAQNSTALLKYINGNFLSDYNIGLYDGTGWTQDFARQALRWERRLELSMEGHRFFDLVRWGVASATLDEYLAGEKLKRGYLGQAAFVQGKHEYMPIPQQQINLSKGSYKQNEGYN
jgi:hypothetical protein